MEIGATINGSNEASTRYLSWAPSPCQVRQVGGSDPLSVRVQTRAGSTGELAFYATPTSIRRTFLNLELPADGSPVDFWAGGNFDHASHNDGDTSLAVRSGGSEIAQVPLMIRVRKNANELDSGERDRFVSAFARLNDQGRGPFKPFRDMHTNESNADAHGGPGFLPWHRAYLLDLERELQALDRSVALPYWRFDQPAPNLFHLNFIGISVSNRVPPNWMKCSEHSENALNRLNFGMLLPDPFPVPSAKAMRMVGRKYFSTMREATMPITPA